MYVRFVDAKGNLIVNWVAMDRLPQPGEDITLGQTKYTVLPEAPSNEPDNLLGQQHYLTVLTVAPKVPAMNKHNSARKGKEMFKE